MAGVFIRRLHELDEQAKKNLGEAFKSASAPALLRSAFDLPEGATHGNYKMHSTKTFSAAIPLRFETAPELISALS